MTIGLAMLVKDEAEMLPRTLPNVLPLIDTWTVVDTGSTDGTPKIIEDMLGAKEGSLHHREWRDFGANRTELLRLAHGTADWLLTLDADMEVKAHPRFLGWLAEDHSPHTDAWQVEIEDTGTRWRLPWLIRGHLDWEYVGTWHAGLAPHRSQRPLLGLELTHLRRCGHDPARFDLIIEELARGVQEGDPRSVFYTAEALRFLGRIEEAVEMYDRRAEMETFEEERWYAQYQAAKLRRDVAGLLAAHAARPWRHEPLSAAARIVSLAGGEDDILFHERVV